MPDTGLSREDPEDETPSPPPHPREATGHGAGIMMEGSTGPMSMRGSGRSWFFPDTEGIDGSLPGGGGV